MPTSHEHIDIPGLQKKSNELQVNDAKTRKINKGKGGSNGRTFKRKEERME